MMKNRTFKKIQAGYYKSDKTEWVIEKVGRDWVVYNPTGNAVDTLKTLKEAKEIYK